jgi:hypothetical protein
MTNDVALMRYGALASPMFQNPEKDTQTQMFSAVGASVKEAMAVMTNGLLSP